MTIENNNQDELKEIEISENLEKPDRQSVDLAVKPGSEQPTKLEIESKKKTRGIRLTFVLLLLSAILFLANPLYQFVTTLKVKSEIKEIKLTELVEYEPEVNSEAVIDTSNDEQYIGKIAIPSVALALPIVKGTGADNLFKGAATNTTNQQFGQGNYSLSAHKMPYDENLLFSPLLRMKLGDDIYLTDGKFAYKYETTEIFVVTADQVDILDEVPGKIVTTLYTCETDAGVERHVVRGELQEVIRLDELDKKILKMLD